MLDTPPQPQSETRFESSGRSKQSVFPYEEIVISLPFDHDETVIQLTLNVTTHTRTPTVIIRIQYRLDK